MICVNFVLQIVLEFEQCLTFHVSELLILVSSSKITTNGEREGIWKVMTVVWIKALFHYLHTE
jgi:hypothetical protein